MPIYEYVCGGCGMEFQFLVMNRKEEATVSCPRCRGAELKRVISQVAYHASEEDRISSYDASAPQDESFYRDSRNIGLHAKKRAKELGVDLGPGFEAKLDKLRTDPGSVFKDSE
jgi:putative FmdB family regulatory protein